MCPPILALADTWLPSGDHAFPAAFLGKKNSRPDISGQEVEANIRVTSPLTSESDLHKNKYPIKTNKQKPQPFEDYTSL